LRGWLRWSFLATACKSAKTGAPAATPTGGTFTVESQEPGSLDPPLASGSEDLRVVKELFDGLVLYDDKTAAVTPGGRHPRGLPTPTNTQFTFHLRSGHEVLQRGGRDGGQLRARHDPLLTPKFYNDPNGLGYHPGRDQGCGRCEQGVTTTLTGAIAKDKTTLEVDLSAPDAEFVVRAGHMPFLPLPSDAAMAAQKPSWSENPIGNGPFKMKEAGSTSSPSPSSRAPAITARKPKVDQVVYKIFPDQDTSYLQWQAGNLVLDPHPAGEDPRRQGP